MAERDTHPLSIHPGINHMYKQLVDSGTHWKGMKEDIKLIIGRCEECQINKHSRQSNKVPMVITDTATEPFQNSLDFVGPLPLTIESNQHILALQDDLTKFVIAKATPTTDTATVAKVNLACRKPSALIKELPSAQT